MLLAQIRGFFTKVVWPACLLLQAQSGDPAIPPFGLDVWCEGGGGAKNSSWSSKQITVQCTLSWSEYAWSTPRSGSVPFYHHGLLAWDQIGICSVTRDSFCRLVNAPTHSLFIGIGQGIRDKPCGKGTTGANRCQRETHQRALTCADRRQIRKPSLPSGSVVSGSTSAISGTVCVRSGTTCATYVTISIYYLCRNGIQNHLCHICNHLCHIWNNLCHVWKITYPISAATWAIYWITFMISKTSCVISGPLVPYLEPLVPYMEPLVPYLKSLLSYLEHLSLYLDLPVLFLEISESLPDHTYYIYLILRSKSSVYLRNNCSNCSMLSLKPLELCQEWYEFNFFQTSVYSYHLQTVLQWW
jgi:hypothetical protein